MKICNRDFINIVIESFIAVCKIASKKTVRVSAHISFNGYYHPFCIAGEHLKFQLHLPVIAEPGNLCNHVEKGYMEHRNISNMANHAHECNSKHLLLSM